MYYIAYVQGFYINVTLYEAFKLHITVALSTEKLHNIYPNSSNQLYAVGHKLVVALNDTCQKGLMSKVLFTLIALDVVLSAFF